MGESRAGRWRRKRVGRSESVFVVDNCRAGSSAPRPSPLPWVREGAGWPLLTRRGCANARHATLRYSGLPLAWAVCQAEHGRTVFCQFARWAGQGVLFVSCILGEPAFARGRTRSRHAARSRAREAAIFSVRGDATGTARHGVSSAAAGSEKLNWTSSRRARPETRRRKTGFRIDGERQRLSAAAAVTAVAVARDLFACAGGCNTTGGGSNRRGEQDGTLH